MKKTMLGVLAVTIVLSFSGVLQAQDEVEFEFTSDFNSKYIWRGQTLTNGWVWQPGLSASYKGFTGGIWANMDLADVDDTQLEFDEVDPYIDYSGSINDLISYSIGYIYYSFPRSTANTQEIYGGLSFDTVLSPSVTLYYDIEASQSYYLSFSIGHSAEEIAKVEDMSIGLDMSLSIGYAGAGYNDLYWSVDESQFNDLTLSIGFPFEIKGISVTPSINYMTLLGDDIKAAAGDNEDRFWVGVSTGFSF